MGITFVQARVFNPTDPSRKVDVQFTVDSGAAYSVVPSTILMDLGIEPLKTQTFFLANGEAGHRKVGMAAFEYLDELAYAKVLFGEEGDVALMGVTTLESFGFVLDPLRRELRALPLRL